MKIIYEPCPHNFPAHKAPGTVVECEQCGKRFRLVKWGGERYWEHTRTGFVGFLDRCANGDWSSG